MLSKVDLCWKVPLLWRCTCRAIFKWGRRGGYGFKPPEIMVKFFLLVFQSVFSL